MTEKEINEGNKLIAEFMGFRVFDKRYPRNHGIGAPEAEWRDCIVQKTKYHSSWDWLMPVVEKIEGLENSDDYEVDIFSNCCDIGGIIEAVGKTKIDATYKAITQFIQWYNTQNSKQ
jgi:hypothetical protein